MLCAYFACSNSWKQIMGKVTSTSRRGICISRPRFYQRTMVKRILSTFPRSKKLAGMFAKWKNGSVLRLKESFERFVTAMKT